MDVEYFFGSQLVIQKYAKIKWIIWLGAGFKYLLFSPLPGEMIQFD